MKLVYLIAGTFNAGGMERVLTNKANWLARNGYEVVIVTSDQRERTPYFSLDSSIQTFDLGINYDETNGCSFLRKTLTFLWKQRQHRRRLATLLKKLKADVVVCMFNNDVSFAYKIKDGSHKILEAHFSKYKKLQYGRRGLWKMADCWRIWLEMRIVRKYDYFVVLTQEDKALWGTLPNITVIPNARTFKLQSQSKLTEKCVVAVGRYDYQKGFDRLIEIWHLLGNRKEGWKLDIIGDGPLREILQQQIKQLELSDSVRLLKPTDHIQDVYLNASILVMTSHYEGLPMAMIEAQTAGLPIIAYDCPCGPRDIITDGTNGYLIPNGDKTLFAERLVGLMSDETLRMQMGAAGREASEAYDEDYIMKLWQELFE